MNKCVIVGAGDCSIEFLKKKMKIQEGDLCIAADGGFDYLLGVGITPDIVIGDFDSLAESNAWKEFEKAETISIKKLPVEKDDTDMLAAIKEGLAKGYQYFELYGALGGRFDHAIANIQCLLYLLNRGARGVLIGTDIWIMLIRNESIVFKATDYEIGRRVSVFAYGQDAVGVTEKGLKYLLDNVVVKQEFPIGVSNQFTGENAKISVKEGMLLICVEEKF